MYTDIIRHFKNYLQLSQRVSQKLENTWQVSSMIRSATPIVAPVANIVFCCFVFLDLKSGDGRTDGRTTCVKTMIPTGHDFRLVEWIKNVTSPWSKFKQMSRILNIASICMVTWF